MYTLISDGIHPFQNLQKVCRKWELWSLFVVHCYRLLLIQPPRQNQRRHKSADLQICRNWTGWRQSGTRLDSLAWYNGLPICHCVLWGPRFIMCVGWVVMTIKLSKKTAYYSFFLHYGVREGEVDQVNTSYYIILLFMYRPVLVKVYKTGSFYSINYYK